MKNYNTVIKKFIEKQNTSRPLFRKQQVKCDGTSIVKTVTNSQIMLRETFPVEGMGKFEFLQDIYSGGISTERFPGVDNIFNDMYRSRLTGQLEFRSILETIAQCKVAKGKLVHIYEGRAIFGNGVSLPFVDEENIETWVTAEYLRFALEAIDASGIGFWKVRWDGEYKPIMFEAPNFYEILITPVRIESEEGVRKSGKY